MLRPSVAIDSTNTGWLSWRPDRASALFMVYNHKRFTFSDVELHEPYGKFITVYYIYFRHTRCCEVISCQRLGLTFYIFLQFHTLPRTSRCYLNASLIEFTSACTQFCARKSQSRLFVPSSHYLMGNLYHEEYSKYNLLILTNNGL